MIIYNNILLCQYLYFLDLKKTATSMNDSLAHKPKIRFVRQRNDAITPDIIMKSFWISTSLALILAIPPLTIFLAIFHNSGNLLMGALIGFGIHFVLFALSGRISSFITSLLDD